jgi:hypothetical protein
MYLDELVDAVVELLNSSQESWVGDFEVEAQPTLDWATCLTKTELQVLVVPDINGYNLEQSLGRRNYIQLNTTKNIMVMVGKGFELLSESDDVAPWEESKVLIRLRESIAKFLIANSPIEKMKLISVEDVPIDELEMDHRNFIAVVQLAYEDLTCGSPQELQSSSQALDAQSGKAKVRAYLRQQLSSAKKQDSF